MARSAGGWGHVQSNTRNSRKVLREAVERTAALGGEFPKVQFFEGEIDIRGQLAGSDVGLGETLQVWKGGLRVKEVVPEYSV